MLFSSLSTIDNFRAARYRMMEEQRRSQGKMTFPWDVFAFFIRRDVS